jgi:hypothetical protein
VRLPTDGGVAPGCYLRYRSSRIVGFCIPRGKSAVAFVIFWHRSVAAISLERRPSPAFVYFPPDRFGSSISVSATLPIFFLGLVQGHYDVEREMKVLGDVGRVSVNAGIATVVPAQDIYDLLMSEDVAAERENAVRK